MKVEKNKRNYWQYLLLFNWRTVFTPCNFGNKEQEHMCVPYIGKV